MSPKLKRGPETQDQRHNAKEGLLNNTRLGLICALAGTASIALSVHMLNPSESRSHDQTYLTANGEQCYLKEELPRLTPEEREYLMQAELYTGNVTPFAEKELRRHDAAFEGRELWGGYDSFMAKNSTLQQKDHTIHR